MNFRKKWFVRYMAPVGEEGGFDTAAAVDAIGADLGLGQVEEIDNLDSPPERKPVAAPTEGGEPPAAEVKEGDSASTTTDEDPTPKPAENTAPKTWKPEVAKHWAALPPEVQAEIQRREQDIFNGINQYKEAADFGKGFYNVLKPYIPVLQQYNVDPHQQVANLMHSHYTLAFGKPEEKVALIKSILADYKIDFKPEGGGEPSYTDPEVENLRAQLSSVQSELQALRQGREAEVKTSLEARVEAFAKDPANKYFNDVLPEMTALLQSGAAKDIKQAYDLAIYQNPAVRQKVLDEELAKRNAAAEEARKKKLEEAEKASALSRKASRQVPGNDTAARGSMDDTLQETFRAITSR